MRPPRIVAFVGIDGAGKSTAARRLAAGLTERGVRARYSQNPGGRRFFSRLAQRFGRADAVALLGRRGFFAVECLVRWLAIARGLLFARLSGRVAVMDRYSYCQYVTARTSGMRGERFLRAMYAVFPRPDVVFFLDLPADTALRRITARATDTEDIAYLRATCAAYRGLPEFSWFTTIDATGEPETVAAATLRALDDRRGCEPEPRHAEQVHPRSGVQHRR